MRTLLVLASFFSFTKIASSASPAYELVVAAQSFERNLPYFTARSTAEDGKLIVVDVMYKNANGGKLTKHETRRKRNNALVGLRRYVDGDGKWTLLPTGNLIREPRIFAQMEDSLQVFDSLELSKDDFQFVASSDKKSEANIVVVERTLSPEAVELVTARVKARHEAYLRLVSGDAVAQLGRPAGIQPVPVKAYYKLRKDIPFILEIRLYDANRKAAGVVREYQSIDIQTVVTPADVAVPMQGNKILLPETLLDYVNLMSGN
jgi:hypothetical protein